LEFSHGAPPSNSRGRVVTAYPGTVALSQ
jgi:hypothetical protein